MHLARIMMSQGMSTMGADAYDDFIAAKTQLSGNHGFDPIFMPDFLFDFQKAIVEWAIRKGRAAIFADCGLGKTPMELVWAENITRHTNKRVIILTPLAVSAQIVREGEKFGIEASRDPSSRIVVTNYEQLHKFNPGDFIGCVCDESSILKSYSGARKNEITQFMRHMPYRLTATATAAPNDFIELGTTSEALGYLGHIDMLNRFFKNDLNNSAQGRMRGEVIKWRLKGHAEGPFWQWVSSWARAIRKPSDMGFSDERFILPPLSETEHMINVEITREGFLFPIPAIGLKEQREERRLTLDKRCESVAEIVNGKEDQSLVWCHLNDEGDLLENLIPDAVQVSGSDTDTKKEEAFLAFANGDIRVLVSKPKIGAWGLNFQGCHHVTFFPSHSFEQYYQAVRRCYRFGQTKPVQVDIFTTEGEAGVLKNLQRKAAQADEMFAKLIQEMNNALDIPRTNNYVTKMELPSWLS